MATMEKGLCQCGCGGKTNIPNKNSKAIGWIKGQPMRFIHGHHRRNRNYFKEDKKTGCHVWNLGKNANGYGRFWNGEKAVPAHRHFYEQAKGKVPDGLQIDHLCRNRACVNPDHLEAVTPAENTRRSNSAKLTQNDVDQIRVLAKVGWIHRKIATRFNVSRSNIGFIVNYKSWKNA